MIFTSLSVHATQWSVSNNAAIPAQFSNLNVAVNSSLVLNGDTLIVQGSNTAHPATTINKSLTIIGPGFNPNKTDISVANMSNLTIAANNVHLIGLSMTNGHLMYTTVTELSVENCYFQFKDITNSGAFAGEKLVRSVIKNCVFYGSSINLNAQTGSSVLILNNVFHQYFGNSSIRLSSGQTLVSNCSFSSGANAPIQNMVGATFKYCIFYGGNNATFIQSCVFKKCLFWNLSSIPGQASGSGNSGNIYPDMIISDPMFVSVSPFNVFNFLTTDYHLSSSSTGILTVPPYQIGVYGGGSTFTMTGEPYNSSIIRNFEIITPNTSVNGNLNFNIHITPPTSN